MSWTLDRLARAFENETAEAKLRPAEIKTASRAVLERLDRGEVTVWDVEGGQTRAWVKRGILAYFRTSLLVTSRSGPFEYWDRVPMKRRARLKGVRIVPGAVVRQGSFVASGSVVMPSFINVGAHVGAGTMVDTWATVGSCAFVGAGVHISGGVGIGGVLEPAQARPVVIGDGAFLGSRAIIVEGVRVGVQAVLGAGVVLTASTKIIDVRGAQPVESRGEIPARAVVIPGSVDKKFAAGTYGVPCALIIGTRRESTDLKTSLNQALREHGVAV